MQASPLQRAAYARVCAWAATRITPVCGHATALAYGAGQIPNGTGPAVMGPHPAYMPTTAPASASGASPMYQSYVVLAHAPVTAPSYSPGTAPASTPGTGPAYSPGTAPAYTPGTAPAYSPGTAPAYTPGTAPAYAPGPAPAYAPETAPACVGGTSPAYIPSSGLATYALQTLPAPHHALTPLPTQSTASAHDYATQHLPITTLQQSGPLAVAIKPAAFDYATLPVHHQNFILTVATQIWKEQYTTLQLSHQQLEARLVVEKQRYDALASRVKMLEKGRQARIDAASTSSEANYAIVSAGVGTQADDLSSKR